MTVFALTETVLAQKNTALAQKKPALARMRTSSTNLARKKTMLQSWIALLVIIWSYHSGTGSATGIQNLIELLDFWGTCSAG